MGQVDFQDSDGRTPNRCLPHQTRAIPLEMLRPLMAARMKKSDDASRTRIASGNIRAFMVVAEKTGQCQVSSSGQAAVLARNNVVNLKREIIVGLEHLAIFTEVSSTPPD